MRDVLWCFARGDMPAVEFETWLYANHEDAQLEASCGPDLLLALLETPYGSEEHVHHARSTTRAQLLQSEPLKCRCPTWRDVEALPLGLDTATMQQANLDDYFRYSVIARRTPWLECVECRECGQAWYLGTDTSDHDEHRLVRLDEYGVSDIRRGLWPTVFDEWEAVWPDQAWLVAFGYDSLDDWLAQHPPEVSAQLPRGHEE